MVCATIARSVHYEEYIGEPETFLQTFAHFFFLQKIFGFESISVGVWYVAIDWQLYIFISLLLFSIKRLRTVLVILAMITTASMMYFSHADFLEDYFIYFVGAYGLGVIAYLADDASHPQTRTPARICILLFGILIVSDTFFEIQIKNIIDWMVALLLVWKGRHLYRSETFRWTRICIWFSQRSYCAFLIHFSVLLLGNSIYYYYQFQSPNLALLMMIGIWLISWVFAHLLYQFVEYPSRKIQIR
jgi:peptidoglycan/LPS O-acetylase OafA/YrhL